ncbi:hypothetical protein A2U01_0029098 [Trifolium medium]|uniref:Uncharacterized protein n=1 Tax=Trifolium medium TaxID=97028 RepID=A0A392P8F1_9FABA|nr:hypothetical protein [Trifolium medium]
MEEYILEGCGTNACDGVSPFGGVCPYDCVSPFDGAARGDGATDLNNFFGLLQSDSSNKIPGRQNPQSP